MDEAKREDGRSQELYDRTLLSDHERQQARIALVEAESAVREARAAVTRAGLDLTYSRIKAPYDAYVLAVNVVPGQAVVSQLQSRPRVVLAGSRAMLAEAEIEAGQIGQLAPGQPAKVGLGGEWLPGRVYEVGMEPLRQGERDTFYRLSVMFEIPEGQVLRAGLPAVLRLQD